jgi:uncharacterized phage protein (TIGR02218 family)
MSAFFYCFDIHFFENKTIFLTSIDITIELNNKNYLPYSGLRLVEAEFNDSAKNYVILSGVFEKNGIERWMNLSSTKIDLRLFKENILEFTGSYICTKYIQNDLDFNIYLEPETIKYNKSLLNHFSQNCRADFGDIKCKVNKELYKYKIDVFKIIGTNIVTANLPHEDGYFVHGEAIFENKFVAKILNHSKNEVQIDKKVPDAFLSTKHVILILGCEKTISACCKKFNNILNFRGEPFIPEQDFLD